MQRTRFRRGDLVVLHRTEHAVHPDPSGRGLVPSEGGDTYSYVVDTFAVVIEVTENGRLRLQSKDGRQFTVRADDLNLRRAGFWDRWWHQDEFPDAASVRTA